MRFCRSNKTGNLQIDIVEFENALTWSVKEEKEKKYRRNFAKREIFGSEFVHKSLTKTK